MTKRTFNRVTLARPLAALAGLLAASCAGNPPAPDGARIGSQGLRLRAPDLSIPLVETLPLASQPEDAVKAAVFQRVNRDRAAGGLPPVAWDEAASRVADAFCTQQVREATRGHFLKDGIPPYARTGFAGVFGMQSENSVSWVTTGPKFSESPLRLALSGHDQMMAEVPPQDGHRRTILDPEATHVGVGYALERGRFQMAQEFLARRLERLALSRREAGLDVLGVRGKALAPFQIQFVTIAREHAPFPLTREEANLRSSYSYPQATLAWIPEGQSRMQVEGTDTQPRIRLRSHREFSLTFAPAEPGLYTLVFYVATKPTGRPRPGGSAAVWFE